MNFQVLFALTILPYISHALFTTGDAVVELTPDNIDQMMKSRDLWFIKFYAPWCGHCQSFAPEYKKAAQALKGVVRLGAIDMDKHRSLGEPYGIRGFPTVKVFGSNKNQPEDYQGGRTADAIVSSAMSHLQRLVQSRLGGEDQSQRGGQSGGSGSGSGGSGGEGSVIELTDANFEKTVLQSDDMWLVEFYAPWCGHCKNLKPHWDKAARELGGKVKLGALDATVHNGMASKYGIQGFPTIKFFPAGAKDGQAAEYDGGRTADDIVRWAMDKVSDSVPPPEIVQVTEQKHLTDACDGRQLCIISVLPHILDSQSEGRNKYLEISRELGNKYKKHQWGWVWVEAGAQMKLEESLGIGGFGYPAMAALNARKFRFAPLRGPYTLEGINEFLRALSMGRGRTEAMRTNELPKIVKSEPWDGKDAKPPVEEEIDLSDLDLDSPPKKVEL